MGNWNRENKNDKVNQNQLHKGFNVDLKIIKKKRKKRGGDVTLNFLQTHMGKQTCTYSCILFNL